MAQRVFDGKYNKPVTDRISIQATVGAPFVVRFTFKLSGVYRAGSSAGGRLPTPWIMRTWASDATPGAAIYTASGQCTGDLTETRLGLGAKPANSSAVSRNDGPGFGRHLSPDEWANVVVYATANGARTKLDFYLGEVLWASQLVDGAVTVDGLTFGVAADETESAEFVWGVLGLVEVYKEVTASDVSSWLPTWTREASARCITPAATVVDRNDLSRGRQRYLGLQSCEAAAWAVGPIETTADIRFDKWLGSGFTDLTHGASRRALTTSLTTRWRFAFPYHDDRPAGGNYIRAVYGSEALPRPIKAWYDSFANWTDGASLANLRGRVQVLSLGDEFADMFDGDLGRQVLTAQRFAVDLGQMKGEPAYQPYAKDLLVELTGAGITQLRHARALVYDAQLEAYHRTASNMFGVPYRTFDHGASPAPNEGEAVLESHYALFQTMTRMGHMRKVGLLGNSLAEYARPIPYGNTMLGLKLTAKEVDPGSPVTDPRRFRPSDAQLCFQQYVAWTYGALWTCWYAFDIDADHGILFEAGGPTTTSVYDRVASLNARGRLLGRALVNLISTDVRIVMNRRVASGDPPEPSLNHFEGLLPYYNQPFFAGTDSALEAVTVKNVGGANHGRTGPVLLGYFKPLARDLVEPQYADDLYLMITNGLAMSNASLIENRQEITLTFRPQDGYDRLQRLDDEGQVVPVPVTRLPDGRFRAVIVLDGGVGELFKLARGPADSGFRQLVHGRDTLYFYRSADWAKWGYVTGINENGGRSGFAGKDARGYLAVGPYIPLRRGPYSVRYRAFVDDTSSNSELVSIDVASERGARVHARRQFNGSAFAAPYRPQELLLRCVLDADVSDAEFRFWWAGHNEGQADRGSAHLAEIKLLPYTFDAVGDLFHQPGVGRETRFGLELDGKIPAGFALYGPYLPKGTLPAGVYTAYFRIAANASGGPLPTQPILSFDVVEDVGGRQISIVIPDERHPDAEVHLRAEDLALPTSQRIAVPFHLSADADRVEFRARWSGLAGVRVLLEDVAIVPYTASARSDLTRGRGRPEGDGLAVTSQTPEGFVAYGPYAKFGAGTYRASFRLMANSYTRTVAKDVDVIHVDVAHRRGAIIEELFLKGEAFLAADTYQDFVVEFTLPSEVPDLELRAYFTGFDRSLYPDVYLNFAKVTVEKIR